MSITKQKRTHREQTSGYQEEKERERCKPGVENKEAQTTTYKVNKLQGYIVQHGEFQPIFYNNYNWSITYKIYESLRYTPEDNIINQLFLNKKRINMIHKIIKRKKCKKCPGDNSSSSVFPCPLFLSCQTEVSLATGLQTQCCQRR